MIFSAYLQTANTLAWLAPRVIVTKLVSDYLTGLLPWPGVCPLSQLCLACLTGNLWGICPVLLQKQFHTSLLFCFSPMHVVAPFSFSVFWFFTPITTLQVWVMEACQAKKRPGSSVFVKQFGVEWPFTLAFRSGLHWAGWHRRKAPFRALCLHMLVIHGCITMGTAGWELRTQWKIITINKSRSWTGGTSEKSCRFHRSFSLKLLKLRSSCTSVKVRS